MDLVLEPRAWWGGGGAIRGTGGRAGAGGGRLPKAR
jgi:hypothetical protein